VIERVPSPLLAATGVELDLVGALANHARRRANHRQIAPLGQRRRASSAPGKIIVTCIDKHNVLARRSRSARTALRASPTAVVASRRSRRRDEANARASDLERVHERLRRLCRRCARRPAQSSVVAAVLRWPRRAPPSAFD
jgi:hypothetical protein